MPDIKVNDIDRHLKSGRPSCVYLIIGDDRFRKENAARKLISGLKPENFADVNYRRYQGDRDRLSDVCEATMQAPMFDRHRLTVMEDFPLDKLNAADGERLCSCVSGLSDASILIIWQNDAETDMRKSLPEKLIKLVRGKGSVLKLDIPTANECAAMLGELAAEKGARLSLADANYMVKRCGRDMVALSGELEKLALYAGKKNITQQMIDDICPATLEADVFHISKNILWGKTEEALRITNSLLLQKTKPVEIFGVLNQNFIDLYRAKCAAVANMDAEQLKAAFSTDYPKSRAFRADNAMREQREYSLHQLRGYIDLLFAAELALKGGKTDKRVCLEQLIVRLCYIKRGKAL